MSDEKQIDEAVAWCADRDRVKRLEALVREAWPDEALELCCDNSEPESHCWFARQYGHGNFTAVISIDHPNSLDALEAALLVLNGPEALREFAFVVVAREGIVEKAVAEEKARVLARVEELFCTGVNGLKLDDYLARKMHEGLAQIAGET